MLHYSPRTHVCSRSGSQNGAAAPATLSHSCNRLLHRAQLRHATVCPAIHSNSDSLLNRDSSSGSVQPRVSNVAARAAYTGSVNLGRDLLNGYHVTRESIDPMKNTVDDVYSPGATFSIHSPEELTKFVAKHSEQVLVLMCKARACRPCKMFTRKYMHMAERFTNTVFLDITGDESMETRSMMIQMQVKSTPTFILYKHGELVETIVGTSASKLKAAIRNHLRPDEPGYELDAAELEQLHQEGYSHAAEQLPAH